MVGAGGLGPELLETCGRVCSALIMQGKKHNRQTGCMNPKMLPHGGETSGCKVLSAHLWSQLCTSSIKTRILIFFFFPSVFKSKVEKSVFYSFLEMGHKSLHYALCGDTVKYFESLKSFSFSRCCIWGQIEILYFSCVGRKEVSAGFAAKSTLFWNPQYLNNKVSSCGIHISPSKHTKKYPEIFWEWNFWTSKCCWRSLRANKALHSLHFQARFSTALGKRLCLITKRQMRKISIPSVERSAPADFLWKCSHLVCVCFESFSVDVMEGCYCWRVGLWMTKMRVHFLGVDK